MKRPGVPRPGRSVLHRSELPGRRAPIPRRAVRRRRGGPTDFTPEARAVIRSRSGGRCEARIAPACTGRATQAHHRQRRELGDHRPVNGLDVCIHCHHAIHNTHVREARRRGLLVSRYRDAADVPVTESPPNPKGT